MSNVAEDREGRREGTGGAPDDRAPVLRFGAFELDAARVELRRAGRPVPLEPRPLRLLLYLVEHRDRSVSKTELVTALWQALVSDAALAGAVRDLRRALGDSGHQQRWIRTRRSRGYQFVGSLETRQDPRMMRVAQPAHARPRIFGAPRGLSTCFVGRSAELAKLERLTSDARVGGRAAIEGVAGIGKTELALQLAYRLAHRGQFAGGIFWLDAERADLQQSWGGAIADQYGIEPGAPEVRCHELVRVLSTTPDPILLVLDNVESWDGAAQPGPLPSGSHVHLLVTTRRQNLAGAWFEHLELGHLRPPHDRELLTSLAGRDGGPGLDELLEYLGGYVLALELAGAFLATFPLESARSCLDELRRNADVERSIADRTRYERTVDEAFRTVWRRLSPALREAWWLASFFEPVPVPPELAAACGIDRRQQDELRDAHLIQCDTEGRWTMHRLIRSFGRRSSPEPARALGLLLPMGPQLMQRSHAGAELESVFEQAVQLAEQTSQIDDALRALDGLWYARCFQGAWSRAAEIARMLDSLTASRGSDRQRLFAQRAWGGVLFYTGKHEAALRWLEQGAEVCRWEMPIRGTVTHVGVFVLAHAGLASAYLGYPDRALQHIEAASRLAAATGEPADGALALYGRAAVHSAFRNFAAVRAAMHELREIYLLHSLLMFDQAAPHGIWADLIERERLEAADRERIDRAVQEMRKGRTLILVPTSLVMLAEVCGRCGEPERARELLDQAESVMQTTGERCYEPELWRVRASLASSAGAAVENLEHALWIAREQHSRLFALRCATDLVEATAVHAPDSRPLRLLRELLAELSKGLAQPDLVRAQQVLRSHS